MSVPMSQVLTTARTYLNDDNATQFPDPVLIPKVQEAHRELQTELWVVGSPLVRNVASIVLPTTSIPSGPQGGVILLAPPYTLVSDFLTPTALYETPGVVYTPMTETFFMPLGYVAQSNAQYWMWQDEILYVAPFTHSPTQTFVVQYRRQIPIPVLATDVIGISFGETYLSARAAAIAAGTVGNAEVFTALTAIAKEQLSKVIVANRGQQKPNLKP